MFGYAYILCSAFHSQALRFSPFGNVFFFEVISIDLFYCNFPMNNSEQGIEMPVVLIPFLICQDAFKASWV